MTCVNIKTRGVYSNTRAHSHSKGIPPLPSEHNLERKLQDISSLHITSLLVCRGYLWVGTSTGATLVYRTPYLETVPIVTGKPYLATDAHRSAVRVLLTTHTVATLTSSRLSQFISDEQERYQEDWEMTETFDDSFTSSTTTRTSACSGETPSSSIHRRLQYTSDVPPAIREEQSLTPSPLPSPNLSDDPSPDGTLQNGLRSTQPETSPTAADPNDDSSTLTGRKGSVAQPPDDSNMPPSKPPRKSFSNKNRPTAARDTTGTTPEATNTSVASVGASTLPAANGISPELPPARAHGAEVKSQAERDDGEELDEGLTTFRRVPTPEIEASMRYAEDLEMERIRHRSKSPSPYEEPAPLDLTGPIPVHTMPELTATNHMTLRGHPTQPLEGAIYVLTGGRGLVNLRQGKRRSVYSMALSGTGPAEESCIIAYELKRGYM